MSVLIGIISYLPRTDVRTKRLEASRFQIEYLHKILPSEKIIVVAQGYDDADYLNEPYIEYVKHKTGIGAGPARNIILDTFYKSTYDWLFLWDDDTVLYPYYDVENFLLDILYNEDKFKQVDAVSALEPEYYPYKKLNYEDKANLTYYKFEPRVLNSGSATSIIRNVRKFYGKTVFYPDVDANKGEGREDIEFLIAWLKEGLNWYTMQTMIRKSLCFDKSSIFGSDTKARDALLMKDLDVICERYAKDGITRDTKGKITWSNFNNVFNKSEKLLYIERNKPIEYDEQTKPKEKLPTSKALFDF